MIILVVSMIIVGGFTRLTDSGLSITKWELFKGIIPPLNERDGNPILIFISKLINTSFFSQI